ncbi:MAG TPA: CRISPR-associated endonuclease Cas2 [Armatimonadetes bacterium]|nr:CRISPR-associated endonuclease Cas2 [Armatimonadota bacterium]
MGETLYVVAYDVADNRRRARLAKELLGFGQRVQWSVFECRLEPPRRARLSKVIAAQIDPTEDVVHIYRLCGSCAPRVATHGLTTRDFTHDEEPGDDALIV